MKKVMIMKRLWIIILCLLWTCSCAPVSQEQYLFAMDTVMTFRLEGDDGRVFALCRERVEQLEKTMSATDPESALYQLNAAGTLSYNAELWPLLEQGLRISRETDGALCLSLRPVTERWNFTGENPTVPSAEELEALRPLVDDAKIRMDKAAVTLEKGMKLDLGAVGKGYTADELAKLLKEQKLGRYFLSLGGNVQVKGGNADGTPWRIGIADPDGGDYVGIVRLFDGAVVTSGGYQRNFRQNGTVYHHILDRETLSSARSGLKSVTVVHPSGTVADALSTAFFVMGEERALAYCAAREEVGCILITEDDRVVIGGTVDFTLHNEKYKIA